MYNSDKTNNQFCFKNCFNSVVVKRITAKISAKQLVSSKVYRISFALQQPDSVNFLPGQFLNLIIDNRTRRSYSIASLPNEGHELTTYVDITPGGPGSKFFLNCQLGDEVTMLAPLGSFIYRPVIQAAPSIFLSTGTGLVPFISMIKSHLPQLESPRDFLLYQGFRYEQDIFGLDELTHLKESGLEIKLCLSRPGDEWNGSKGYVQQNLLNDWDDIAGIDASNFYLCGDANMIEQTRATLKAKGIGDQQIFYEKFY